MAKAGLCSIAYNKKSISAVLDIAAKAGADGVEIWGQPDHIRYPIDGTNLRDIREHAEALALEICALGSYYAAGGAVEYAKVRLDARNQVKLARDLGAPVMRIWPGVKSRDDSTPAEVRRVIDDIRLFADHAGDAKVCVVLERHVGTLTHGWDGVAGLLSEIGHENVFLNYQVVYPATEDEYEERGAGDFTALLGLSRHAHLQNYLPADDGGLKRSFLDSGLVDYSSLGKVARSAGYHGYFMVEFPAELNEGLSDSQTVRRDIDFIKGLR
jgi:sugar phosphate isomerase/epimerase